MISNVRLNCKSLYPFDQNLGKVFSSMLDSHTRIRSWNRSNVRSFPRTQITFCAIVLQMLSSRQHDGIMSNGMSVQTLHEILLRSPLVKDGDLSKKMRDLYKACSHYAILMILANHNALLLDQYWVLISLFSFLDTEIP